MTNKITSVVELSQNEVNNVSGGLDMPYVVAIEAVEVAVAGFMFQKGAAIAAGITFASAALSYFIKNQNARDSFRCAVYTLGMTLITVIGGLKLIERQRQNA